VPLCQVNGDVLRIAGVAPYCRVGAACPRFGPLGAGHDGDVTDRRDQTVLTTGANSGIGLATVLEIARPGYRSVGTVRPPRSPTSSRRYREFGSNEVGRPPGGDSCGNRLWTNG
jgi:hypothetical protein